MALQTFLTLSTPQLLEAIAVLTANVQIPFRNGNRTGLFSNAANYLQMPDNATNQLAGSHLHIDASTNPGYIVMSGNAGTTVGNNPIPADGPFGIGTSVLSTAQLCEIIAVLLADAFYPYPAANSTGLFRNGASQLQFPDNAANQLLANQQTVYGDGVWLYCSQQEGQVASGA